MSNRRRGQTLNRASGQVQRPKATWSSRARGPRRSGYAADWAPPSILTGLLSGLTGPGPGLFRRRAGQANSRSLSR